MLQSQRDFIYLGLQVIFYFKRVILERAKFSEQLEHSDSPYNADLFFTLQAQDYKLSYDPLILKFKFPGNKIKLDMFC